MKNIIPILLAVLFLMFSASDSNAQLLRKFKAKIEKKADDFLGLNEPDSNTTTTLNNNQDTKVDEFSDLKFDKAAETIFMDAPGNEEIVHHAPSNWNIINLRENDNHEIVEFEGEKVIRLAQRQELTPVISENSDDYLPADFTFEFDASFSANALEQRYWLSFYDMKTQKETVAYETLTFEITLTPFGVIDGNDEWTLNGNTIYQELPSLTWRHIAIAFKNNHLDFFYDGQHICRKSEIPFNLTGITISRSEFSDQNRYLKNIRLATN